MPAASCSTDIPRIDGDAGAVRSGWFDVVDLTTPHTPASLRSD
ncbi:MAG TPA: hypothetical protein VGM78_13125 [Ilumatobacteraceae bacterium]